MQITGRFGNSATPPPALPSALTDELRAARKRYRKIYLRRTLSFWWYRLLLVVLTGCVGAILGAVAMIQWKILVGALIAPAVVFFLCRRLRDGLILLVVAASPLIPPAFSVKSLDVYPVEAALLLLLGTIIVLLAFHTRPFVWPALAAIWPQIGLIALAIISDILIQATWIHQVSRKLNSTSVVYSELLGIAMYCVPLLIIVITTACLTGRDQWIVKVQNTILALSALAALIVCVEFRHIGADVYTFRYTEPMILYMRLGALAQFIGLGAMIAYARALYSPRWRARLAYLGLTILFLGAVYFTLEKARLVYTLVGLVVITLIFSRRLFVALCALSLPLIPVALSVLNKLAQTKAIGDLNRFVIWQDMLRVWLKRPIFGVGPGNVWPYDQVFTHLPIELRNLDKTGLGVAHNGVLQVLVEVGPLGVFCYYAFAFIIVMMAVRLYRRSRAQEQRADRLFAMVCLGLIFGSLVADPVSGIFFQPPAQIGGFNDLPRVFATWIIFGCLIYKDQVWRTERRRARRAQLRGEDELPAPEVGAVARGALIPSKR